jgi:hypothetical protein
MRADTTRNDENTLSALYRNSERTRNIPETVDCKIFEADPFRGSSNSPLEKQCLGVIRRGEFTHREAGPIDELFTRELQREDVGEEGRGIEVFEHRPA